jgi:hypothetical protein
MIFPGGWAEARVLVGQVCSPPSDPASVVEGMLLPLLRVLAKKGTGSDAEGCAHGQGMTVMKMMSRRRGRRMSGA